MKFSKTTYDGISEILATKNFEAIGVMVKSEGVVVNGEGKKIVKAGTVVGGDVKSALTNDDQVVVDKNTALLASGADGVLLRDVDVTHGDNVGTMIIRGQIDLNKIVEPVAEAVTKLNSRILFIK